MEFESLLPWDAPTRGRDERPRACLSLELRISILIPVLAPGARREAQLDFYRHARDAARRCGVVPFEARVFTWEWEAGRAVLGEGSCGRECWPGEWDSVER